MTGFITSISELIALIFQSLRLPMLLPSLVFAVVNVILVIPNLRKEAIGGISTPLSDTHQTLLLILITLLTTYLLNSLNLTIIRWFEGYPLLEILPPIGRFFQSLHQDRYQYLKGRREELEIDLEGIVRSTDETDPDTIKSLRELRDVLEESMLFYPQRVEHIAPTRLGNVMAAAEFQPHTLYKIDAITFWPLLVPILTKEDYSKFIEQEKSSLDFLLNTLIVIAIMGIEMIWVGVVQQINPYVLALSAVAIILTCWLLYNLSIQGAMGWGQTIRTAFHLYRHKLREELKIKPYDDLKKEREIWELASAFYKDRDIDAGYKIFDFRPKDNNEKSKKDDLRMPFE